MRWRVERAGSPGHWIPGWIATDRNGLGASFNTWEEAYNMAYSRASIDANHAWRGLVKLAGRRSLGGDRT